MLFKFTTEQIGHFKGYYISPMSCLRDLVGEDKFKTLRYPSIKYASSVEEGWREFTLCFHKDREKVYQDMLRPKYKNGNKAYRIMGN